MFGRMVSSPTIELLRLDGLVGNMRAGIESAPTIGYPKLDQPLIVLRTSTARPYGVETFC